MLSLAALPHMDERNTLSFGERCGLEMLWIAYMSSIEHVKRDGGWDSSQSLPWFSSTRISNHKNCRCKLPYTNQLIIGICLASAALVH